MSTVNHRRDFAYDACHVYAVLVSGLFASACVASSDEPTDQLGEAQQEVDSNNGISLNGISLNGISLNGKSLNGISLNGISLNGISLNGVAISGNATTAPPLNGASIVGSTWTGTTTSGTSIPLRIDRAVQGTGTNADLWFYGISFQTTSGWSPLCGLDATGTPVLAVSVAGTWKTVGGDTASYAASTTQFTLACRAKTVAKCVELGYKTFKGRTTQLQTCVRLLRGDFCGNGTPYTVDGTVINIYDNVGVQADTEAWGAEAEWTPSGARCINSNKSQRFDLVLQQAPKCIKTKSLTCGTTFTNGAVLIDELSPSAVLAINTVNSQN
ncbi:MAG TPA: ADYC domain-containing protein [Kofleriaceae bacterium]|nr:ADYC domain-containing protein [Kofleriaceae bacterium]